MWTQECLCLCDTGQRRIGVALSGKKARLILCPPLAALRIRVFVFVYLYLSICVTRHRGVALSSKKVGLNSHPPLVSCRIASFRLGQLIHVMVLAC